MRLVSVLVLAEPEEQSVAVQEPLLPPRQRQCGATDTVWPGRPSAGGGSTASRLARLDGRSPCRVLLPTGRAAAGNDERGAVLLLQYELLYSLVQYGKSSAPCLQHIVFFG